MTLLKICGLTRRSDVELVDEVADYAGFIVDPETRSPRRIPPSLAKDLASVLSKAKPVAVFDSYDPASAVDLAAAYDFPIAQIPRKLDASVVERAEERGIALAPVVLFGRDDVVEEAARLSSGDFEYVLVDAIKEAGLRYEHGLKVPLELIRRVAPLRRVAIAGGITPENVERVLEYNPYMIDVASGVESEPGVKDKTKVMALAEKVRGFKRGAI